MKITFSTFEIDGQEVNTHKVIDKEYIRIGTKSTADLQLYSKTAGRMHCLIEYVEKIGICLIDLQTGSTRVNERLITATKTLLVPGNILKLGGQMIHIDFEE